VLINLPGTTAAEVSDKDDELRLGSVLGIGLSGGSDGGFSSVLVAKQKTEKDYKRHLLVPSV